VTFPQHTKAHCSGLFAHFQLLCVQKMTECVTACGTFPAMYDQKLFWSFKGVSPLETPLASSSDDNL